MSGLLTIRLRVHPDVANEPDAVALQRRVGSICVLGRLFEVSRERSRAPEHRDNLGRLASVPIDNSKRVDDDFSDHRVATFGNNPS